MLDTNYQCQVCGTSCPVPSIAAEHCNPRSELDAYPLESVRELYRHAW